MNIVNKDSSKIDRGQYGKYCRKDWIDKEFATLLFQRVLPFLPNDNNYAVSTPIFELQNIILVANLNSTEIPLTKMINLTEVISP